MTSWHGNVFHLMGPLWRGSTSDQWIPWWRGQWRRYLMLSLFIILNNLLNKQLSYMWFGMPWHSCDITIVINTLRQRQNGCNFPDDIFKWIFLNENVWISIKVSLKFVPKIPINNIPALVQIMAWRRSGDKPLSEPMMDSLLTHICMN